jgi:hypothetical protein
MVESKEVTTLDELGAAGNQLSNPLQHRIIVLTILEIQDIGRAYTS